MWSFPRTSGGMDLSLYVLSMEWERGRRDEDEMVREEKR
jgi:hypothetical protein